MAKKPASKSASPLKALIVAALKGSAGRKNKSTRPKSAASSALRTKRSGRA